MIPRFWMNREGGTKRTMVFSGELQAKLNRNRTDDLRLKVRTGGERSVMRFRPARFSGGDVDEFELQPEILTGLLHRADEQRGNAKRLADLLSRHVRTFPFQKLAARSYPGRRQAFEQMNEIARELGGKVTRVGVGRTQQDGERWRWSDRRARVFDAPTNRRSGEKDRGHYRGGDGIAPKPFSGAIQNLAGAGMNRLMVQPAVEVRGERSGRYIAAHRILLEALQADRLEIAIDLRVPETRLARLHFEYLPDRLERRPAGKRRLTGQQVIQHGAKTIDVGGGGQLAAIAGGSLRRDVAGGAEKLAGARERALGGENFCEAEIRDVRVAGGIEQDISWLEIAVEDAALVRVLDGTRGFRDDLCGPSQGDCLVWRAVIKGRAIHEFHREKVLALNLADFEDGHDCRMIEFRRDLSLSPKTLQICR